MKFRDILNKLNEQFVTESFNTSLDIIKTENGNPDLYYIKIDENLYRIFVEKAQDSSISLHIGFEYKSENGWVINGTFNKLDTKAVLGLFGTILKVLKRYKFDALMFCSREPKKFRTYVRMMDRISKEFNLNTSHNDECIFAFKEEQNIIKRKFKYK